MWLVMNKKDKERRRSDLFREITEVLKPKPPHSHYFLLDCHELGIAVVWWERYCWFVRWHDKLLDIDTVLSQYEV